MGRSWRGGGTPAPAPFLTKTHEMVEEKGSDEVISWAETGKSFVVWKPVEFARDLLPAHFKHNNFSSFVRQLNTYGFRKVVPDRWEFANENFRRREPQLLSEIRRRKPAPAQTSAAKGNAHPSSTSNSGEAPSSSASSHPPPPLPDQHQMLQLSNENAKLRKDNEMLASELAQAKRHCEELLASLLTRVDACKFNIELLVQEAVKRGVRTVGMSEQLEKEQNVRVEQHEVEGEEEKEYCLKLFGVLLKGFDCRNKKRGRCEESGGSSGSRPSKMGLGAPWMGMTPPVQGSSRVCN